MLKVRYWSKPAYALFALLFIAILCFSFLPLPVHLPFGGAGVAGATSSTIDKFYYVKPVYLNTSVTGANIITDASEANFPLVLEISAAAGWSSTELGHFFSSPDWNTNGKRIQIFDSTTANLAYEVGNYTNTGDTATDFAYYYVKKPLITGNLTGNSTNNNYVTIAYGNDPNGSDQDSATGVWDSNYVAVYPLGDNYWGTSPHAKDATGNGYDGTDSGTTDVGGQVSRGRDYNALYRTDIGLPLGSTSAGTKTISMFVNPDTNTISYLTDNYDATSTGGLSIIFNTDRTIGISWTASINVVQTTATLTLDAYSYLAATFATGTTGGKIYINDALSKTGNLGTEATETNKLRLSGRWVTANTGDAAIFDGFIDEVRVSNIARSADWLKLEYYSMKKTTWIGDSMLSWGSENINLPPQITTLDLTSITSTSVILTGNITSLGGFGNVTSYGFVLSTTTQNNPGNVSPSVQTLYTAGNWTWTGVNYGAGQTFDSNGNVTGLNQVFYYYRAAVYVPSCWVYSNESGFYPSMAAAGSWLPEYSIRTLNRIAPDNIDGILTDFPVLAKFTPSNFDFDLSTKYGYDLRFTSFDGTTLFPYDRVEYINNGWQQGGLSGYDNRIELKIDHNKISGNLTDFPVLVKLTKHNFDFTKSNSDGYDIRFVDVSLTPLAFERVRHDAVNRVAEYQVVIPLVSSTTDTIFYLYYRTLDTVDGATPEDVWDGNFTAINHLNGAFTDSTSNNVDGTNQGTDAASDLADSYSISMNGAGRTFVAANSDYIDFGTSNSLFTDTWTIEMWVGEKTQSATARRLLAIDNADTELLWIGTANGSDADTYDCGTVGLDSDAIIYGNATHLYYNVGGNTLYYTYYIVFTGDGNTMTLYQNNVAIGSDSYSGTFTLGSMDYKLGRRSWAATGYADLRYMSEVRISNICRSAAWIEATYKSGMDDLLIYQTQEKSHAEIYVKMPLVSDVADTYFYCYQSTTQTIDGADPENTWDGNFTGVFHGNDIVESVSDKIGMGGCWGVPNIAQDPLNTDRYIIAYQDYELQPEIDESVYYYLYNPITDVVSASLPVFDNSAEDMHQGHPIWDYFGGEYHVLFSQSTDTTYTDGFLVDETAATWEGLASIQITNSEPVICPDIGWRPILGIAKISSTEVWAVYGQEYVSTGDKTRLAYTKWSSGTWDTTTVYTIDTTIVNNHTAKFMVGGILIDGNNIDIYYANTNLLKVYLVSSTDKGANWGAPVEITAATGLTISTKFNVVKVGDKYVATWNALSERMYLGVSTDKTTFYVTTVKDVYSYLPSLYVIDEQHLLCTYFRRENANGISASGGEIRASLYLIKANIRNLLSLTLTANLDFASASSPLVSGVKKDYGEPLGLTNNLNAISVAQQFDGVNDYATLGNNFNTGTGNQTIELWFTGTLQNTSQVLIDKTDDAPNYAEPFYLSVVKNDDATNGGKVEYVTGSVGAFGHLYSTGKVNDGAWHYAACVRDVGVGKTLYIDNLPAIISRTDIGTNLTSTVNSTLGRNAVGGYYQNGKSEEIRFSNVVRSAAWIEASYYSELDDILEYGEIPVGKSLDLGIVQANYTYWSSGAEPDPWPLEDADCWESVINLASFTQDAITAMITDFEDGAAVNIVSTIPGTNEVRVTLFKVGDGESGGLGLTNAAQEWVEDVAADEEVLFELKLETGTFTVGNITKTATLTFATEPTGDVTYVVITFITPWISNTPSSHDFLIVQPSQTYWAKTNSTTPPSFPLAGGNCTGNVTNNSSFAVDITAYAGNMTGGTEYELVSGVPGADEFRLMLLKEGDGANMVIQYDDFEWGVDEDPLSDSGGNITWTPGVGGSGKVEIDDSIYHAGSQSALLYKDGSNNCSGYFSQVAGTEYNISFWVFRESTAPYFMLRHGNGTLEIYAGCYDGHIRYWDGASWQDGTEEVNSDEWSKIEIRDIDWGAGTYDIWCNSILDIDDALMISSGTNEDIIKLINMSGGSTQWIDDVYVMSTDEPEGSLILTNAAQSWIPSLGAGLSQLWELRFETWSSNSDGAEKTCIITFTAEAS